MAPQHRIIGIGSPHGDDQAGWEVIARLKRYDLPAQLVALRSADWLVQELEDCSRAWIVDACRTGQPPGTLTRFAWPDPGMRRQHAHSTHGLGVIDAIALAEALGQLPGEVVLYGIEIDACQPGAPLSSAVADKLPALAEQIRFDFSKAFQPQKDLSHGGTPVRPS